MRCSLQRYSLFSFYKNKKSTALVFLYRCRAFYFSMTHTAPLAFASYKLINAFLQVWGGSLKPARTVRNEHLRKRGYQCVFIFYFSAFLLLTSQFLPTFVAKNQLIY
jgi:hypothetical protein